MFKKSALLGAIVLIFAGTARAQWPAGANGDAFSRNGRHYWQNGDVYTETVELFFDRAVGRRIRLGTAKGSVRVVAWERDQVRLVVSKFVRQRSLPTALSMLEDFIVRTRRGADGIEVRGVVKPGKRVDPVGVTYTLWVPKSWRVDVDTRKGSIDIGPIGARFTARTSDGTITLSVDPTDVDLVVEDRSGEVGRDGAGVAPDETAGTAPGDGSVKARPGPTPEGGREGADEDQSDGGVSY